MPKEQVPAGMAPQVRGSAGEGKYVVHAELLSLGADLAIALHGGTHSHVGAVAVAVPRPRYDDGRLRTPSASIITVPWHKEDVLAREVAVSFAKEFDCVTTVACGIHIDHTVVDGRAVVVCRPADELTNHLCQDCAGGILLHYDTVERTLQHSPVGHQPVTLKVNVRRYKCSRCQTVRREDTSLVASERAKLSRRAITWSLNALILDRLSVSRISELLDVSWGTAKESLFTAGYDTVLAPAEKLENVTCIGVDFFTWRHVEDADRYATAIVDLSARLNGEGSAQVLEVIRGKPEDVFPIWFQAQPKEWRAQVRVVDLRDESGGYSALLRDLQSS